MKFRNQFYLTTSDWTELQTPSEFESKQKEGLCLRYSRNLPLTIIPQENGSEIWVLGWLFYKSKLITKQNTTVSNLQNIFDLIESSLVTKSYGRYLIIYFNSQESTYIVGDSAGTLSTFYKSQDYFIASSINLVRFIQYPITENLILTEELKECEKQCHYWYPGGVSELSNIYLLFPNHYLKLGDKEPERFWPSTDSYSPDSKRNFKKDIETCTKSINQSILSFSKIGSLAVPITSGRDSRIILSGLFKNNLNQKVISFTKGEESSNDVIMGSVLASSCNISWLNKEPRNYSVLLPGFGGEICKGYWYQHLDPTIPEQLERVYRAIPFTKYLNEPIIKDKIKEWINYLSKQNLDDYQILDLAYLDFRWASTMGQVHYKYDQNFPYSFSCFASRQFIECSISLPLKIKRRMSMYSYICNRNAPHLVNLPAGIPHYSYRQIPKVLILLILGVFLPFNTRRVLYSKANQKALIATFALLQKQISVKLNKIVE